MNVKWTGLGVAAAVSLSMTLATAPAASASGGDGEVQASGRCSAGSTWKIKAKPDNGRIEVEMEVDSNVVGQTWSVRLTDNGAVIFNGQRTTTAPSGSFEVERRTANRAGSDTFVGVARLASTGEVCRARVVL